MAISHGITPGLTWHAFRSLSAKVAPGTHIEVVAEAWRVYKKEGEDENIVVYDYSMLPIELLEAICMLLPLGDIARMQSVSKRMHLACIRRVNFWSELRLRGKEFVYIEKLPFAAVYDPNHRHTILFTQNSSGDWVATTTRLRNARPSGWTKVITTPELLLSKSSSTSRTKWYRRYTTRLPESLQSGTVVQKLLPDPISMVNMLRMSRPKCVETNPGFAVEIAKKAMVSVGEYYLKPFLTPQQTVVDLLEGKCEPILSTETGRNRTRNHQRVYSKLTVYIAWLVASDSVTTKGDHFLPLKYEPILVTETPNDRIELVATLNEKIKECIENARYIYKKLDR